MYIRNWGLMAIASLVLCLTVDTSRAAEQDGARANGEIVVAQARRCRDNEFYAPDRARANRFGCVRFADVRDASSAASGGLLILSDHGVVPGKCSGRSSGGLCKGKYYVDIRFNRRFARPPHVIVAIEEASSQSGCVGGATDKIVAFPTDITRRGFRLYANGSPAGSGCRDKANWASRVKAGWIAVGKRR